LTCETPDGFTVSQDAADSCEDLSAFTKAANMVA